MIPEFYQYMCPVKIVSGTKALANLPYEMNLLGVRRAMVVTDKGVVGAGLLDLVKSALHDTEFQIAYVYDQTPPDSSAKIVNEVAALFRKHECDCLFAVGGGSTIDTAKGVNIVVTQETDDLLKYQGTDRLTHPTKPLIVIPTTAGTGSEVTQVAVIKDTERHVKMPFLADGLYPRLAILDPRMTMTMPAKFTAATGMDALAHAVEAFFSLQKNPISDAMAWLGVRLIYQNLVKCVDEPKNAMARLAMANAALVSGIAFANAMVGVGHALAHALGGVCDVPHGIANAIMLPIAMEFNLDKTPHAVAAVAHAAGLRNVPHDDDRKAGEMAIQAVRDLAKTLHEKAGLPITLRQAGVAEEKLPEVAATAINDGSVTYNPKDVRLEDALALLKKAY